MIIKKTTVGFVIQTFDTETHQFLSQEFVAGDLVDYEDQAGHPVNHELLKVEGRELSLPFDMKQP